MAQWVKNLLQCRRLRRCGFDPWVRKMPRRRKWQPTPAFCLKKSHGQRSLAGYSLWGCKELDTTERLTLSLSLWDLSHIKGTILWQVTSQTWEHSNIIHWRWAWCGRIAVPCSWEVFYLWKTRAQWFPVLSQKHHIHWVLRWRDTKAALQGTVMRKHHVSQVIMVSVIMKMMHRISHILYYLSILSISLSTYLS